MWKRCTYVRQSLWECFSQAVWNRLANKIRHMHLLKKGCTYSICGERVGGWMNHRFLTIFIRIHWIRLDMSLKKSFCHTQSQPISFLHRQLSKLVTAKGPLLVKGGVTHLVACLIKLLPKQIRNRESSLLSSALLLMKKCCPVARKTAADWSLNT